MPEGDWIAVAEISQIQPGGLQRVQVQGKILVLACTPDGVIALDNACPHEGGPLAEGSVEGACVVCPMHNYKFDGKSGACLTEKRFTARTYPVKTEQGKILVRVESAPAGEEMSLRSASGADAISEDLSQKKSSVEIWKAAKHGIDCWPDILRFAQEATPMSKIDTADLERMKWYGYFYRKNNDNDHYMVRIRIPGCELSSEQARAIAFIAYESGYSIVDVTTRGNVQIQGLTIEKLPGVRAALERVGLTARQTGHDNVRNITSHPHSGIDPEELIDTRDLSRKIQDMIIGSREFSDLPRKCNVALTGRPTAETHAWTQDISYVATWGPGGHVGFHLLLGGHQGQSSKMATPIPVFVRPDQVLDVTAAVLCTFRELGWRHNRHQVRLRFLLERLGAEAMLQQIEKRMGYTLEPFTKALPRPTAKEDFIGWFKQKQHDLWALGVCVPVGRLTWDQFEGLAVAAQQFGWGTLRSTYDQNLIIPGVPSAERSSLAYAIAKHGLSFEPDTIARNLVSCTGKQFCNLAVTETKGYAYRLMEELRRRNVQLAGIGLHMSGCPSSCGMSYTADIGLKGVKIRRGLRVLDAFDMYLGGGISSDMQLGILYQKQIPVDQLPSCIQAVVKQFYESRQGQETFSQYWRRKLVGSQAQEAQAEAARWQCSICSHVHVAENPPIFCPVCSAVRARFEPAAQTPEGKPTESTTGAKPEDSRPGRTVVMPALKKSKPQGKRILIVGGSIAGHTAAQTVRNLDSTAQITLCTDESHSFYNRLNLTRYLAQEVKLEELFDYSKSWYEENDITVLVNSRAIGLDTNRKTLLLEEGRELEFDVCILAHGSAANVPGFYRELPGVYLLRTMQDIQGIAESAQPGTRAIVVGGGVLGLEAAYGIVKRGGSVQVVEYQPYLMPRQLDKESAAIFSEMVKEKGMEPHVGVGVEAFLGEERIQGVRLTDGRTLAADLVVVSTGIKPNSDWVKRAGIHCETGIVVDDRMQTSADNVFACGDVAQWKGKVVGLWSNAIEQAKVAATNAAGKMAFFTGFLPTTILKCLGIPLVSIGEILPDDGAITSQIRHDPIARTYRRVILREGIPIGAILLGSSAGMGDICKLVEQGLELEKLRNKILSPQRLQNKVLVVGGQV